MKTQRRCKQVAEESDAIRYRTGTYYRQGEPRDRFEERVLGEVRAAFRFIAARIQQQAGVTVGVVSMAGLLEALSPTVLWMLCPAGPERLGGTWAEAVKAVEEATIRATWRHTVDTSRDCGVLIQVVDRGSEGWICCDTMQTAGAPPLKLYEYDRRPGPLLSLQPQEGEPSAQRKKRRPAARPR